MPRASRRRWPRDPARPHVTGHSIAGAGGPDSPPNGAVDHAPPPRLGKRPRKNPRGQSISMIFRSSARGWPSASSVNMGIPATRNSTAITDRRSSSRADARSTRFRCIRPARARATFLMFSRGVPHPAGRGSDHACRPGRSGPGRQGTVLHGRAGFAADLQGDRRRQALWESRPLVKSGTPRRAMSASRVLAYWS